VKRQRLLEGGNGRVAAASRQERAPHPFRHLGVGGRQGQGLLEAREPLLHRPVGGEELGQPQTRVVVHRLDAQGALEERLGLLHPSQVREERGEGKQRGGIAGPQQKQLLQPGCRLVVALESSSGAHRLARHGHHVGRPLVELLDAQGGSGRVPHLLIDAGQEELRRSEGGVVAVPALEELTGAGRKASAQLVLGKPDGRLGVVGGSGHRGLEVPSTGADVLGVEPRGEKLQARARFALLRGQRRGLGRVHGGGVLKLIETACGGEDGCGVSEE